MPGVDLGFMCTPTAHALRLSHWLPGSLDGREPTCSTRSLANKPSRPWPAAWHQNQDGGCAPLGPGPHAAASLWAPTPRCILTLPLTCTKEQPSLVD